MAGREVGITWNGRRVKAWVPDPLAKRRLDIGPATVRRTEAAAAAIKRGNDLLPVEWEALARLLLRAEGLASSFIEGVQAQVAEVAAAEFDPTVGEPATWVAANLAAVKAAVDNTDKPLTRATLNRWHRTLMHGATHLPKRLIGRPRDAQGWIGGTSPLDAALVTPPPEHVGRLLDDLIDFANRDDIDPVTQAAAAHAQFEVVHPYADGNGRIGRVLVGWILTRRLNLLTPPPVSVRIAVDRDGYLSGLTLFRLGDVDPWVRWFADVVAEAGDATVNLVRAVEQLHASWLERLRGVRVDAAARRVLPLLPRHPVISAQTVADAFDITERTARTALDTLTARGVLQRYRPATRSTGRPRQWWVATELTTLIG